jgi:hypothetical protein
VRLPTQDTATTIARELLDHGLRIGFAKDDETDAYRNYITKASHRKYSVIVAAHPVTGELYG